jgi:hypothetical protein
MQIARGSRIGDEVKAVRHSLRALDRSLQRLVPLLALAVKNGSNAERPRRRPRLSPKARASLVLQGRYMGYMRQLKPRQKAQVRKVKEAKGVRVAIARARELTQAQSH